ESVVNTELMQYLGDARDKYPHQLQARYPRIVDKIVRLWNTAQLPLYLSDLLIDSRGARQGFPPEIAREIFALSLAYDAIESKQQESEMGSDQPAKAKRQLEQSNLCLTAAH